MCWDPGKFWALLLTIVIPDINGGTAGLAIFCWLNAYSTIKYILNTRYPHILPIRLPMSQSGRPPSRSLGTLPGGLMSSLLGIPCSPN